MHRPIALEALPFLWRHVLDFFQHLLDLVRLERLERVGGLAHGLGRHVAGLGRHHLQPRRPRRGREHEGVRRRGREE